MSNFFEVSFWGKIKLLWRHHPELLIFLPVTLLPLIMCTQYFALKNGTVHFFKSIFDNVGKPINNQPE